MLLFCPLTVCPPHTHAGARTDAVRDIEADLNEADRIVSGKAAEGGRFFFSGGGV